MQKVVLALSAFCLLALPALPQLSPSGEKSGGVPQPGFIVPKVVTLANPGQSYALYLPSTYSSEKRWPIVYAFDPGARGRTSLELMKDAAERYGYIVVGSNNSRNGSWKIEAEAAEAMLKDTHARWSVEDRRVYFAGFSGGARVAAQVAQLCKCAAGVLLNGAGFQPQAFASHDGPFVVFAAVGTYDFNYPELVRTDEDLEKLGYAHFLRRFDGPHQWAPSAVMEEALAWFRLEAMRSGRESREDSFITKVAAQEAERAHAFEQSGDGYAAWKEYRQAAEVLAGLTDNTAFHARAAALEKDKAVREGAKHEKQEFEEQDQFTREISLELSRLRENRRNPRNVPTDVGQQIIDLRNRAARERREEKLRVLKRALAGVLVQTMEMGFDRLDQKDPGRARQYFELASDADPDSVWAMSNLAVAKVLDGDGQGALESLRRAKDKTKDLEQFFAWLKEEPAFVKLHGRPEFAALLELPAQH